MLDFDQVIRTIGPMALVSQQWDIASDKAAQNAIATRHDPARVQKLITWLRRYAVLMGLNGEQRNLVAQAALDWCDSRPASSSVDKVDDLIEAHRNLSEACHTAIEGKRNFTSLASKVLWLRYSHDTPIYDRNAQYALWMLSKCIPDVPSVPPNAKKYAQFATIWKHLFERHRDAIQSIDIGDYPYRVRIFDRILWILGAECYTVSDAIR